MPTSATRSRTSGPERVRRTGGPLERAGLSEPVIESPDRARRPRRPQRKARRRVIAGGYGEEEQRSDAGCIGLVATGGDSFTDSWSSFWPVVSGRLLCTCSKCPCGNICPVAHRLLPSAACDG